MMKDGKANGIFILFLLVNLGVFSQMQSGKIVYERKTNLEKKFRNEKGDWLEEFLKTNKYKTDVFDLNFNDSISYFKPTQLDEVDQLSWATNKNSTFQNFNTQVKHSILVVDGEEAIIQDIIIKRKWKITDSKRMIGKYECTKAYTEMSDSSRIYAWFSNEILLPYGPEGFSGLPGTILGLATEDGGVVYFAKSVEFGSSPSEELILNLKRKKVLTMSDFRSKLATLFDDSVTDKEYCFDLLKWI